MPCSGVNSCCRINGPEPLICLIDFHLPGLNLLVQIVLQVVLVRWFLILVLCLQCHLVLVLHLYLLRSPRYVLGGSQIVPLFHLNLPVAVPSPPNRPIWQVPMPLRTHPLIPLSNSHVPVSPQPIIPPVFVPPQPLISSVPPPHLFNYFCNPFLYSPPQMGAYPPPPFPFPPFSHHPMPHRGP